VGIRVGLDEGSAVGILLGLIDGKVEGFVLGIIEGKVDGFWLGLIEGRAEGDTLGFNVGRVVGFAVGFVGTIEGVPVGRVGTMVGVNEGGADGQGCRPDATQAGNTQVLTELDANEVAAALIPAQFCITTAPSAAQDANAKRPTLVTLLGIVSDLSPLQY